MIHFHAEIKNIKMTLCIWMDIIHMAQNESNLRISLHIMISYLSRCTGKMLDMHFLKYSFLTLQNVHISKNGSAQGKLPVISFTAKYDKPVVNGFIAGQ